RAADSGPATELEGDWKMVSGIFNGKPMKDFELQWVKREFRGNRTKITAGPNVMLDAEFTLAGENIDYSVKGKTHLGIYKLSNGTLTIQMGAAGANRPKDFEPSSKTTLTAYRRVTES